MFSELRAVGVIDIPSSHIGYLASTFDANGVMTGIREGYDQGAFLVSILDKPADLSLIFGLFNSYTMLGRNESFENEFRSFFTNYLGASVGLGGLLQPDYFDSHNNSLRNTAQPDLEYELLKTLAEHDESLNPTFHFRRGRWQENTAKAT